MMSCQTELLASVTVNEFTLEKKVELSTKIYIGEVVGIVENNDGQEEIYQYIQLKVKNDIIGNDKGVIVNVVSLDGFPASNLEIDCIGGVYLFFLQDYISFKEVDYQMEFLQPVNLKFSVYKVEDGKVKNFVDGKSLGISETKKLIHSLLKH
jgi:hypothetical protein